MTHKNNNVILGIDTSCYTTFIAAIVLDNYIFGKQHIKKSYTSKSY